MSSGYWLPYGSTLESLASASAAASAAYTELESSPVPPRNPSNNPPPVQWRSAREIAETGLPSSVTLAIEKWCFLRGISAHVYSFTKGRRSSIVYMSGQCFICRDENKKPHTHHSNHWVFIQSPGFSTIRIRCHSTGATTSAEVPFAVPTE